MALTQKQQDLIDFLKLSGIEKDYISAIVLPLAKSERKIVEMLDYLIDNLQKGIKVSTDDAMGKMYRIVGFKPRD